jgi:hypothetical protein
MLSTTTQISKTNHSWGITKIEVEEPSGESTTITEPDDMINRILQRNKRHFSQATGTHLLKPH